MLSKIQSPANGGALTGLQTVVVLGGSRQTLDTPSTPNPQAPWSVVRTYERKSRDCIREALSLRGVDRFNALALGSTYALAARDAALMVGGVQ